MEGENKTYKILLIDDAIEHYEPFKGKDKVEVELIDGKAELSLFSDADKAIEYIRQNLDELKNYDRIICDLEMHIKNKKLVEEYNEILNSSLRNDSICKKIEEAGKELEKIVENFASEYGIIKKDKKGNIKDCLNSNKTVILTLGKNLTRELGKPFSGGGLTEYLYPSVDESTRSLGGAIIIKEIRKILGEKSNSVLTLYTSGFVGNINHVLDAYTRALALDVIDPKDLIEMHKTALKPDAVYIIINQESDKVIYNIIPKGPIISKSKRLGFSYSRTEEKIKLLDHELWQWFGLDRKLELPEFSLAELKEELE